MISTLSQRGRESEDEEKFRKKKFPAEKIPIWKYLPPQTGPSRANNEMSESIDRRKRRKSAGRSRRPSGAPRSALPVLLGSSFLLLFHLKR